MCNVRVAVLTITTEAQVRAMFLLANIDVIAVESIDNEYSPSLIDTLPWWKVQTPFGMIKLGNRKRVISIDWTDTDVRHVVTEDHVTKTDCIVHAWSVGKAVNYLTEVQRFVTIRASGATEATETDEE
jgi:hypothetical protein